MKAKIFLRIASGLMIFHLIGHSMGNATWMETDDPIKQEVINQMTMHEFLFMGNFRSMGEYYSGYGYCVSVALLFFAIILWIVSGSLKDNPALPRKIIFLSAILLLSWSIVEFIFFFPFAACTTLLAAIFSFLAFLRLGKKYSLS